jgi:hypothetical protein
MNLCQEVHTLAGRCTLRRFQKNKTQNEQDYTDTDN